MQLTTIQGTVYLLAILAAAGMKSKIRCITCDMFIRLHHAIRRPVSSTLDTLVFLDPSNWPFRWWGWGHSYQGFHSRHSFASNSLRLQIQDSLLNFRLCDAECQLTPLHQWCREIRCVLWLDNIQVSCNPLLYIFSHRLSIAQLSYLEIPPIGTLVYNRCYCLKMALGFLKCRTAFWICVKILMEL